MRYPYLSQRRFIARRAVAILALLCAVGAFGAALNAAPSSGPEGKRAIVIAHRGASAYLPEHTLPAKALAHGMGADFIEQDVVLTRDGVPVVLHDIYLDATTDVSDKFPGRAREDGRYYAIDFTLEEVRGLRARERIGADGKAAFAQRFPLGPGLSGVPTLEEEIQLIEGLNRSRGMRTGLYIEMKGTAFHRKHGQDLPAAVIAVLEKTGWDQRRDQVFLQSFEPAALRYLKDELGTRLPLIQLIGENAWMEDGDVDFDAMRSDAGLDDVASYADGIGPFLMQIYQGTDDRGQPLVTDLVERAHARRLLVHPFTFRADQLPPGIDDFADLHELFFRRIGVDGVFTDFPDRSLSLIRTLADEARP